MPEPPESPEPRTDYAHLDLETDMLADLWAAALDQVQRAVTDLRVDVERVVDLGAGNGVATIDLARRFPAAHVIAVDSSAQLLTGVRDRAAALDLGARVDTVNADLDDGWPSRLIDVDLTWASMSLHHTADADRVLRGGFAATRPGGVLIVAELGRPMSYLTDDAAPGRPGLETRAAQSVAAHHGDHVPPHAAAWSPRLQEAGWQVLDDRELAIELDAPLRPSALERARQHLRGLAHRAVLDDADRVALAALVERAEAGDPTLGWQVRGSRTLLTARKPG